LQQPLAYLGGSSIFCAVGTSLNCSSIALAVLQKGAFLL